MDRHPSRPRPRPPLRSATSDSSFSRISTVSDFTDLGSFDTYTTYPPAAPRPALASLQTSHSGSNLSPNSGYGSSTGNEGYTYASPTSGWTATLSNSPNTIGYSPVASTEPSIPYQQQHQQSRSNTRQHHGHEVIPEEDGADLGLVTAAAPIAREVTKEMEEEEEEEEKSKTRVTSVPMMFDLTSTLGPTTMADAAFLKTLQDQEAHGKLTGGLGLGMKTDMTVTESALLASSPVSERPLSRSFTKASNKRKSQLSRAETLKRLGQSEANKRGEVIEVVMDHGAGAGAGDGTSAGEPPLPSLPNADLSLVAGQSHSHSDSDGLHDDEPVPIFMKQTTFPTRQPTTAVFYPQPNWKPFSMRWPYMVSLIVVSLALGACVEVLYRSSAQTPLVTFQAPSDIPTSQYFAIKFLPMIVAVSYGVLWQITNFEVMRLEPFYQLSKEGGALASESINVDYLTQFNLFRPFRALHYRHYAVAVSSVASLLANTLVPTLGAASIILTPDRPTRTEFPDREKHILMHPVWSRLLTATLVVVACMGCVLFYQLQSRRSGLLADVKGIAGLASMATVSHILMDFKDMDVATHQDIHHKLKNRRYVLRNSSLAPDDSLSGRSHTFHGNMNLADPEKQQQQEDAEDRYANHHLSHNPQPLMLRPAGAYPFLALILLFLALLPLVLFTPATALTDHAPWLITALAVIIKLSWGALETDVRVMEPYYILSRRHAPPKTLCLDYTAMPFGWVAVKGLVNGHGLVFAVGLGTVVAEVLTVLVTSLATVEGRVFVSILNNASSSTSPSPTSASASTRTAAAAAKITNILNAGQETVPSFWLSLALALTILLYLLITATTVFARRGSGLTGTAIPLPRQPNTIASVLAYIHQSKMLYGFVGTNKLSQGEMLRRLEEQVRQQDGSGKTYGLGWFRGRDGQSHCGVDEEELLSGYKAGYDYSRATKPWEEGEVNWL